MKKPPEMKLIVTKKPNPELVTYIETLLDYAKSGDLRGICGVGIWHQYSMTSLDCGRDGHYERSLVGQLEVVKIQVLDGIIEAEMGMDGGDEPA